MYGFPHGEIVQLRSIQGRTVDSTYDRIALGDLTTNCYADDMIMNSFFFANYVVDKTYLANLFKASSSPQSDGCGFYEHYFESRNSDFSNQISSSPVTMVQTSVNTDLR